jgi:predicted phosphoribosyltransferase
MWRCPENVFENPAMRNRSPVFEDRADAGVKLAELMVGREAGDAVVCAVPAGGVPVGAALAAVLHLPLDVLVVSKMTLPWNSEVGFGAVAADGTLKINRPLVQAMSLDDDAVSRGVDTTSRKVASREREYRRTVPARALKDRSAVLVDDGLASGFTMRVAIQSAQSRGAAAVVVAVPTGHHTSVEAIAHLCDRVYCANVREGWSFAVAAAYATWSDVSEAEVAQALKTACAR